MGRVIVKGGGIVTGSRSKYVASSKIANNEKGVRVLFSNDESDLTYTQADNVLSGGKGSPRDNEILELIVSPQRERYLQLGQTGEEREENFKNAIQKGLDELWKEMGVTNVRYVAGIHQNTDQTHAHILIWRGAQNEETGEAKIINFIPRSWIYGTKTENSKIGKIFDDVLTQYTIPQLPKFTPAIIGSANVSLPARDTNEIRSDRALNSLSEQRFINPEIVEGLNNAGLIYANRSGSLTYLRRNVVGQITGYDSETGNNSRDTEGFFYVGDPLKAKHFVVVENPKEMLSLMELTSHRNLADVCFVAADKRQSPTAFTNLLKSRADDDSIRVVWALNVTKEGQSPANFETLQNELLNSRKSDAATTLEFYTYTPKQKYGNTWHQQILWRELPGQVAALMTEVRRLNAKEIAQESTELDTAYEKLSNEIFSRLKIDKEGDDFVVYDQETLIEKGRYQWEFTPDGNVFTITSINGLPAEKDFKSDELIFVDEIDVLSRLEDYSYRLKDQDFLEALGNETDQILKSEIVESAEIPAPETTDAIAEFEPVEKVLTREQALAQAKAVTRKLLEIPLEEIMSASGLGYVRDKERSEWVYQDSANAFKIKIKGDLFSDRYDDRRGGRGSIQLWMHLNNCDFKTARQEMIERFGTSYVPSQEAPLKMARSEEAVIERKPLILPSPNQHNTEIIKTYLIDERAVSRETINALFDAGEIYANSYKSVVFLHRSLNDKTITGASWRATQGTKRQDVAGSDKNRGWFHLGDFQTANRFVITESPIEAISYYELHKENDLSKTVILASSGNNVPLNLIRLIEEKAGPDAEIVMAFNNDKGGQQGYYSTLEKTGDFVLLRHKRAYIAGEMETVEFSGNIVSQLPTLDDWNEDLKQQRKDSFQETEMEHIVEEINQNADQFLLQITATKDGKKHTLYLDDAYAEKADFLIKAINSGFFADYNNAVVETGELASIDDYDIAAEKDKTAVLMVTDVHIAGIEKAVNNESRLIENIDANLAEVYGQGIENFLRRSDQRYSVALDDRNIGNRINYTIESVATGDVYYLTVPQAVDSSWTLGINQRIEGALPPKDFEFEENAFSGNLRDSLNFLRERDAKVFEDRAYEKLTERLVESNLKRILNDDRGLTDRAVQSIGEMRLEAPQIALNTLTEQLSQKGYAQEIAADLFSADDSKPSTIIVFRTEENRRTELGRLEVEENLTFTFSEYVSPGIAEVHESLQLGDITGKVTAAFELQNIGIPTQELPLVDDDLRLNQELDCTDILRSAELLRRAMVGKSNLTGYSDEAKRQSANFTRQIDGLSSDIIAGVKTVETNYGTETRRVLEGYLIDDAAPIKQILEAAVHNGDLTPLPAKRNETEDVKDFPKQEVAVISYRDDADNRIVIDTTSRAEGWSKELSPFNLKNIELPNGMTAKIFENAWQYSKVYQTLTDAEGNPSDDYFYWARTGFASNYAERYPMGKGAKPEYAYWNGKKLDYLEARKEIYIPLYRDAVKKTAAFQELKNLYQKENGNIVLRDFDGYDYLAKGMSLKDVLLNEERPCGHAFVLAMMLKYGEDFTVEQVINEGIISDQPVLDLPVETTKENEIVVEDASVFDLPEITPEQIIKNNLLEVLSEDTPDFVVVAQTINAGYKIKNLQGNDLFGLFEEEGGIITISSKHDTAGYYQAEDGATFPDYQSLSETAALLIKTLSASETETPTAETTEVKEVFLQANGREIAEEFAEELSRGQGFLGAKVLPPLTSDQWQVQTWFTPETERYGKTQIALDLVPSLRVTNVSEEELKAMPVRPNSIGIIERHISDYCKQFNLHYPALGISYGYTGNVSESLNYDDRQFKIFTRADVDGQWGVHKAIYGSYKDFTRLVEDVLYDAKFEKWLNKLELNQFANAAVKADLEKFKGDYARKESDYQLVTKLLVVKAEEGVSDELLGKFAEAIVSQGLVTEAREILDQHKVEDDQIAENAEYQYTVRENSDLDKLFKLLPSEVMPLFDQPTGYVTLNNETFANPISIYKRQNEIELDFDLTGDDVDGLTSSGSVGFTFRLEDGEYKIVSSDILYGKSNDPQDDASYFEFYPYPKEAAKFFNDFWVDQMGDQFKSQSIVTETNVQKVAAACVDKYQPTEIAGKKFNVETQELITRQDVKDGLSNDKFYLFGDNLQGTGFGGQAKELRGEPNSIGIPTKKTPSMDEKAFFTDAELVINRQAIDKAFAQLAFLPEKSTIVIPTAGLGTGLAKLKENAPQTFEYLNERISHLSGQKTFLRYAEAQFESFTPITFNDEYKSDENFLASFNGRFHQVAAEDKSAFTRSIFDTATDFFNARLGKFSTEEIEYFIKQNADQSEPNWKEHFVKVLFDEVEVKAVSLNVPQTIEAKIEIAEDEKVSEPIVNAEIADTISEVIEDAEFMPLPPIDLELYEERMSARPDYDPDEDNFSPEDVRQDYLENTFANADKILELENFVQIEARTKKDENDIKKATEKLDRLRSELPFNVSATGYYFGEASEVYVKSVLKEKGFTFDAEYSMTVAERNFVGVQLKLIEDTAALPAVIVDEDAVARLAVLQHNQTEDDEFTYPSDEIRRVPISLPEKIKSLVNVAALVAFQKAGAPETNIGYRININGEIFQYLPKTIDVTEHRGSQALGEAADRIREILELKWKAIGSPVFKEKAFKTDEVTPEMAVAFALDAVEKFERATGGRFDFTPTFAVDREFTDETQKALNLWEEKTKNLESNYADLAKVFPKNLGNPELFAINATARMMLNDLVFTGYIEIDAENERGLFIKTGNPLINRKVETTETEPVVMENHTDAKKAEYLNKVKDFLTAHNILEEIETGSDFLHRIDIPKGEPLHIAGNGKSVDLEVLFPNQSNNELNYFLKLQVNDSTEFIFDEFGFKADANDYINRKTLKNEITPESANFIDEQLEIYRAGTLVAAGAPATYPKETELVERQEIVQEEILWKARPVNLNLISNIQDKKARTQQYGYYQDLAKESAVLLNLLQKQSGGSIPENLDTSNLQDNLHFAVRRVGNLYRFTGRQADDSEAIRIAKEFTFQETVKIAKVPAEQSEPLTNNAQETAAEIVIADVEQTAKPKKASLKADQVSAEAVESKKQSYNSRTLLLPEVVELTPSDRRDYEENKELLNERGFQTILITEKTLAIKAIPTDLTPENCVENFVRFVRNPQDISKRVDETGEIIEGIPVETESIETALAQWNKPEIQTIQQDTYSVPSVTENDQTESDYSRNYRWTNPELHNASPLQRLRWNIEAIELLRSLNSEYRAPEKDEQDRLARFSGWGSMKAAFDPTQQDKWKEESAALKRLLSESEYKAAESATLNSHFTSPTIVDALWQSAVKLGFRGGKAIEPSVGIGVVLGRMPEHLIPVTKFTAIEKDELTAKLCSSLYQDAVIKNSGYEDHRVPDGWYDLAIGNVPFGNYKVHDERYNRLNANIHDYFLIKSLDQVRGGGVQILITSAGTLDKSDDTIRQRLAKEGKLIGAMRLPSGAFKDNAGTEVVTDVLIFQKKKTEERQKDLHDAEGLELAIASLTVAQKQFRDLAKIIKKADKADNEERKASAEAEQKLVSEQIVNAEIRITEEKAKLELLYPNWLRLGTAKNSNGDEIEINQYFVENPQMIIGNLKLDRGLYHENEMVVEMTEDFPTRLQEAISSLPADIITDRAETVDETLLDRIVQDERVRHGSLKVENGKIFRAEKQIYGDIVYIEQEDVKPAIIARTERLLSIRDAVRECFNADLQGAPQLTTDIIRDHLNTRYDEFVSDYGALHLPTNQKLLQGDPDLHLLLALEDFDKDTKKATKAAIFVESTITAYVPPTSAENMSEAVGITLNEYGKLHLPRVVFLLKKEDETSDAAFARIENEFIESGLVYHDPVKDEWITRDEYLAGNVREKHAAAVVAATENPTRYAKAAEELFKVIPEDLDYTEIDVELGVSWLDKGDVSNFAAQLVSGEPEDFQVTHTRSSGWTIGYSDAGSRHQFTPTTTEILGTKRMNMIDVVQSLLDGRKITIYDTIRVDGSDRQVINVEATDEANGKARDIQENFQDWIWTDDERRTRLHRRYNDLFRSEIPINWDGSHLTFPGMAKEIGGKPFELRSNQKNAAWRAIRTGSLLFQHEAGGGKTYLMIASAMKMKQLGLLNKPAIAALKANVRDITKDAKELYPGIRIISTSDQFETKARKETVSRISTNNYDLVVMTHDHIDRLPMKAETRARHINEQLDELRGVIIASESNKNQNRLMSRLKTAQENLESRLKDVLTKTKDESYFEETGIDSLFIDEIHYYKSLPVFSVNTDIKGIPTSTSDRAMNMFARAYYLQEKSGGRNFFGATGTSITNTVAELHIWQKFFQREKLEQRGIANFDAWMHQFARTVTKLERTATGAYKQVTRLSEFTNVPELVSMTGEFMDIYNIPKDGEFKRPKVEFEIIKTHLSEDQKDYIQGLQKRAQNIKRGERDNMLAISTDARKLSLDERLVVPYAEDRPDSKVNLLVDKVLANHEEKNWRTQMIFAEMGVHDVVFPDIIRKLSEKIPREKIINFATLTESQRKTAIQRLRSGEAVVGLGSTKTLGTGVNAQDHLYAIHNLDTHWIPAYDEQRRKRMERDGNIHYELGEAVKSYYYLTEGGFDEIMYQANARKHGFISTIINAEGDPNKVQFRRMKEVDGEELSYDEIAAVASGNPLILEQLELQRETEDLMRADKRHRAAQLRLKDDLNSMTNKIEANRNKIEGLRTDYVIYRKHHSEQENSAEENKIHNQKLKAEYQEWRTVQKERVENGELKKDDFAAESLERDKVLKDSLLSENAFQATIVGKTLNSRIDAAIELKSTLDRVVRPGKIGEYKGFDLETEVTRWFDEKQVSLGLKGASGLKYQVSFATEEGAFQSMESAMRSIPRHIENAESEISVAEKNIVKIESEIGKPFKYKDRLVEAQKELENINFEISIYAMGDDEKMKKRAEREGKIQEDSTAAEETDVYSVIPALTSSETGKTLTAGEVLTADTWEDADIKTTNSKEFLDHYLNAGYGTLVTHLDDSGESVYSLRNSVERKEVSLNLNGTTETALQYLDTFIEEKRFTTPGSRDIKQKLDDVYERLEKLNKQVIPVELEWLKTQARSFEKSDDFVTSLITKTPLKLAGPDGAGETPALGVISTIVKTNGFANVADFWKKANEEKVTVELNQRVTVFETLLDEERENVRTTYGGSLAKLDETDPFGGKLNNLEGKPLAYYWWMVDAKGDGQGRVMLQAGSYELIRQTYKSLNIDKPKFIGMFNEPGTVDKMVEHLDKMAVAKPDYASTINRLSMTIINASREAEGTVIFIADKRAIAHEDFHAASFIAGRGQSLEDRHARFEELVESPIYQAAKPVLVKEHKTDNNGLGVEELANEFAEDNYAKYKATKEEKDEFLHLWFTSFAEKNGTLTKEEFKELNEQSRKIRDEAYAAVAVNEISRRIQNNAPRTINRDSAEESGQEQEVSRSVRGVSEQVPERNGELTEDLILEVKRQGTAAHLGALAKPLDETSDNSEQEAVPFLDKFIVQPDGVIKVGDRVDYGVGKARVLEIRDGKDETLYRVKSYTNEDELWQGASLIKQAETSTATLDDIQNLAKSVPMNKFLDEMTLVHWDRARDFGVGSIVQLWEDTTGTKVEEKPIPNRWAAQDTNNDDPPSGIENDDKEAVNAAPVEIHAQAESEITRTERREKILNALAEAAANDSEANEKFEFAYTQAENEFSRNLPKADSLPYIAEVGERIGETNIGQLIIRQAGDDVNIAAEYYAEERYKDFDEGDKLFVDKMAAFGFFDKSRTGDPEQMYRETPLPDVYITPEKEIVIAETVPAEGEYNGIEEPVNFDTVFRLATNEELLAIYNFENIRITNEQISLVEATANEERDFEGLIELINTAEGYDTGTEQRDTTAAAEKKEAASEYPEMPNSAMQAAIEIRESLAKYFATEIGEGLTPPDAKLEVIKKETDDKYFVRVIYTGYGQQNTVAEIEPVNGDNVDVVEFRSNGKIVQSEHLSDVFYRTVSNFNESRISPAETAESLAAIFAEKEVKGITIGYAIDESKKENRARLEIKRLKNGSDSVDPGKNGYEVLGTVEFDRVQYRYKSGDERIESTSIKEIGETFISQWRDNTLSALTPTTEQSRIESKVLDSVAASKIAGERKLLGDDFEIRLSEVKAKYREKLGLVETTDGGDGSQNVPNEPTTEKLEHGDDFAVMLAQELKLRHDIRESEFNFSEWQRERKFHQLEIDRGEEEGKVSISIAELDKEARTLAKQAVEKLDKTGLIATQALEEEKPHNEIVKRLFGQNYQIEIGKQTDEREAIAKSLDETMNQMQIGIAEKEAHWIRVAGETEKMKDSLGKEAQFVNAKLQPEEIWRLQEKAGFRMDEAGFFELEILHRENQIPRSQEALARLRGVEKMADVTAQSENRAYEKLTQKHAGFLYGEDEQMRVTVNLKSEDGVIKVTEMSLQSADEKIDKSNERAERLTEMSNNAGKQAVKSLVSPFETQINPFSPVQGKLAWFTRPGETLNNHVNPLQIIKNDPGVQVIRAVYNYAKYTKQAFDFDKQAKNNLETAKDLTERVKPEIAEAMSNIKSSHQETAKAAENVLQRTKDALDWEANIRAKESVLDNAYAENLSVPGKNMSTRNWKKFGDKAVELGDAELLKDFQMEMADTDFARAVGETNSRVVARSIKADAQLAGEARNAISQITKISPTEIQLEVKLSELIKFGEMDATAQIAAAALENLGIKAGVAPLFSPQEELAMRGAMTDLETQTAANLSRVLDDPLSVTESMDNLSQMMAGKPAQLDFEAMNAGQQQVYEEANKIRAVLDEMANAGNVQSLLETQAQFQMANQVNQITADAGTALPPDTFTVNQPVMEMTNLERQTIQNLAEEIAHGELKDSYTEKELKKVAEMEVEAAEIVEEEEGAALIDGIAAAM
jgi:N12 class adenine-specific DNA methylase